MGWQDADVLAAPALGMNAGRQERLDIGQRAAVENRQLQIVELHDHVVHPHADQGREKMLGGGDQHTLAHEAGGVADFSHVAAGGGDLEIVQVGAAEDDARTCRGGQEPHVDRGAGMESYSGKLQRLGDRLFQMRRLGQNASSPKTVYGTRTHKVRRKSRFVVWHFCHTFRPQIAAFMGISALQFHEKAGVAPHSGRSCAHRTTPESPAGALPAR